MDVEINIFSIEDLKHESSPAQKLIQLFSHQNIKIWHLYLAVATLSLHNVMSCLEDYGKSIRKNLMFQNLNVFTTLQAKNVIFQWRLM